MNVGISKPMFENSFRLHLLLQYAKASLGRATIKKTPNRLKKTC
jgi:hypothetical protein